MRSPPTAAATTGVPHACDSVLGCVALDEYSPSLVELVSLAVDPSTQGLGLGKTLTRAGMDYLHNAGLRAIMLYVDADNEAAVSLYRKLGFTKWDSDVMYGPVSA